MLKPYYETKLGKLYHGDCLEIMPELEPVDLVLADPPYGITACSWDLIIPLEPMWKHIAEVIGPNTAVIMTSGQPFASKLVMSNPKQFRYDIIWNKVLITGHLNAAKMPLRKHETILVFYNKLPTYNPQKTTGERNHKTKGSLKKSNVYGSERRADRSDILGSFKYPTSIIEFNKIPASLVCHPAQKPVPLMKYLIKTYSNKSETVLDFAIGSGTTAIACEKLNRRWIGIEISEEYCEIAKQRIINETRQLKLFDV